MDTSRRRQLQSFKLQWRLKPQTLHSTGKGGNNGKISVPKKKVVTFMGIATPYETTWFTTGFSLQVHTICSMFLIEIPLQHQPPTKNSLKSGVEKNTRAQGVFVICRKLLNITPNDRVNLDTTFQHSFPYCWTKFNQLMVAHLQVDPSRTAGFPRRFWSSAQQKGHRFFHVGLRWSESR